MLFLLLFCLFYFMHLFFCIFFFFFFSSRRRHTRFDCDWSSDVCSSDLFKVTDRVAFDRADWIADYEQLKQEVEANYANLKWAGSAKGVDLVQLDRSEERRVGKECRSRWARYQEKEKKKKK